MLPTLCAPPLICQKPGPVLPGKVAVYTLHYRNLGTAAALSTQLADTLPDNVDEKLRVRNDERGVFEKSGMHNVGGPRW